MTPDAFDIIEKLDFIHPLKDGGVELHIAPRPGRLDGSSEMVDLLNRKIQFYLDQLNTEGFQAVFKHPSPEKTVIVLLFEEPAKQTVLQFLGRAKEWVEKNNAALVCRAVPLSEPTLPLGFDTEDSRRR